jgi:hypothetical protein
VNSPGDAAARVPVAESWASLLKNAPIGTQVIWENADATRRCTQARLARERGQDVKDPEFCKSFQRENAIKVWDDLYLAHPFGVQNEDAIKTALANAVRDTLPNPPPLESYIRRYIFLTVLRHPKQ